MFIARVGSAEKQPKRSETGIEPGSQDPESNALDRLAMVVRVLNMHINSRIPVLSAAR